MRAKSLNWYRFFIASASMASVKVTKSILLCDINNHMLQTVSGFWSGCQKKNIVFPKPSFNILPEIILVFIKSASNAEPEIAWCCF